MFLGPNLVSWSSKKQKVISRSSVESEQQAIAGTASEISWIQSLLHELTLASSTAPLIWGNNQRFRVLQDEQLT